MNASSTISADLQTAALDYAAKGLAVFPCDENKQPLVKGGFQSASKDSETVRAWWARWPDAMIGMPTGSATGFWALDIDDPTLFEPACTFTTATRRVDTGKGYHLYFRHDPAAPMRNHQRHPKSGWPFADLPGAETRGDGGYVIVPPSMHPSGRRYAWHDGATVVEAPPALLEIIKKGANRDEQPRSEWKADGADTRYGLAALERECANIRAAGDGEQECALNEAALKIGALVAGGELTIGKARASLITAALAMPSYNSRDAWTPEKIVAKVERGLADGARTPRGAPEQTAREFRGHDAGRERTKTSEGNADHSRGEPGLYGVQLTDFHAFMPAHNYIFAPSGETWPGTSVNSRIPPISLVDRDGEPVLGDDGKQVKLKANAWLDQNRPVEQMTWAPGEPQVVCDRLISDGGWFRRPGCNVFNLYRPPAKLPGNPNNATPWVDHVMKVYPEEGRHIIQWLAHRVQRPAEKINHAIVMGGSQGIGKDTILEPVKAAIGPWNFTEVSPQHMLGRFNGFVKSVILRVSEARDLGDVDRFAFYDHMKTYTAAPPDVLRVDEKNMREYAVFNVCGVIITTNHKTDGIYLPADDRRHYVAWSHIERADFSEGYWGELYRWYASGGAGHVAAYLAQLSLDDFDAKAPPPKTAAFWDIVSSGVAPEDAELADALDELTDKQALTIDMVADAAWRAGRNEFSGWLKDRKNSRAVRHKLDTAGYVVVRSDSAADGLWRVNKRRSAIYVRRDLSTREGIAAAKQLAGCR